MDVRFLLGPAGSGKTHRCVAEVREALRSGPVGLPLLFVAPKQATFQLERQVLMDGVVGGFTRLEIVSFERLARYVLKRLGNREPDVLGEEGRIMVLRALLGREEGALKYFGRSARAAGLARDVSGVLRTFQEHGMGSGRLRTLAEQGALPESLRWKLADWSRLLEGYQEWLKTAGLEDPSELAWQAVAALRDGTAEPWFEAVWMDGFAEMTPAEVALLTAVSRRAQRTTAAFCLDSSAAAGGRVGLWNVVERTFRACHAALAAHATSEPEVIELGRSIGRFEESPVLQALELRMATGVAVPMPDGAGERAAVRCVRCPDPHAEAEAAAGCIEAMVRNGGRYRDAAVLVRSLEEYGPVFARVFRQRGIPSFLDHRHGLRHHPLVELTRTALRVAADEGSEDDWFAWLKSGLLPLDGWEGEELENALRAGRWAGRRWLVGSELEEGDRLGLAMRRVTAPLRRLVASLSTPQDGPGLAAALRALWADVGVEERLVAWDDAGVDGLRHQTVLHEMEAWLEEASRAFTGHALAAAEWLPVVESAWSGLTAGALPPSLDQVLIGAVDRSRNPELSLVLLPGWTEGVFPASPSPTGLLTASDREWLETKAGVGLGPTAVDRIHHEQFYAYIALTRARRSVVVLTPSEGMTGGTLLPSPLMRRWLPEWTLEAAPSEWMLRRGPQPVAAEESGKVGTERLSPAVAESLFGGAYETSASALEQMAGCRFAHFASRVLRFGEREELELGAREQGTWTHELLAEFHRSLTRESLSWRDVTPDEGEARVRRLAVGLLQKTGLTGGGAGVEFALRRAERQVVEWVRHWLEVLGRWPGEPRWVEARFGARGDWPPVRVRLEGDREVCIAGQVDRVDLLVSEDEGECAAWVVDYKRGTRQLRPDQVARGFELQLPLYLQAVTAGTGFLPGGMTYAVLTRTRRRAVHREDPGEGGSYAHRGRVNIDAVRQVAGDVTWEELPFHVKFRKDGTPYQNADGVPAPGLQEVLDAALKRVGELGAGLLAGDVSAAPVANRGELPCDRCAYRGVCRVGEGV
jgi:ATP-dependent helicase/nuclease subunit B